MIQNIKKYWQALRLSEVALMSGFFIIGSFFAIEEIDSTVFIKLLGLSALSFFIVLSVYSFNAAAGKTQDKNNLRLKNLWNFNKQVFLLISLVFFLISIVLSFILYHYASALCFIIIILWVSYSHPSYGLKQKAIWGTLIHFFAQILHFIMAWIIFTDFIPESILIALFFSIAFSSGHILHEIIDYEADKDSGFKTSPVVFGIRNTSFVLVFILLINSSLICYLLISDIISIVAWLSFFPASLIHLLLVLANINNIKLKALLVRNVYRSLYFTAGIVFFVLILLKNI